MKSADVEDGTDAHRDDPELGYRVFGRPVHDDLGAVTGEHGVIRHELNAEAPNELWLTDITEHLTGEGKLHLCAIKDVYSNRIVGYSIVSRMKSRLAVAVLNNAVAKSAADGGEVAGCVIHRDRDLNFEVGSSSSRSTVTPRSDPWAESARPATTWPWSRSSRCCGRTCSTGTPGPLAKSSGSRS